jgi:hypothetical protein
MSELLEIQRSFYKSIVQKETEDLYFISSTLASERFDIYRQTIFSNMQKALKITFSGIWELLGDECADTVAYAFCQESSHLPKTGCLDDFGKEFPKFIGSLKELSSIPYLEDYASYELLKHLAYGALDANSISSADLQNISESQIDKTVFSFVPACFMFSSKFPIHDVCEIVHNKDAEPITLTDKAAYGVITRVNDEVITLWISKDLWMFIDYLIKGYNLSQSVGYVQEKYLEFDLTYALSFILEKQITYKINL